MNLIDWLVRRQAVECSKGEGLNSAVRTVKEFKGRIFGCRGKKSRYSGISSEEILRFILEELPDYYNYTTKAKNISTGKEFHRPKLK
jgi:hypothetical protein